ncbi:hypothetical protein, partial [Escherichia coli]|uniref:hypothetical protein n=1 Tax=Escherichia coli TaxID=562 RepID=UPI001AA13B07
MESFDGLLTSFTETTWVSLSIARQQRAVEVEGLDLRKAFMANLADVSRLIAFVFALLTSRPFMFAVLI